jgi:hypothetical protein
MASKELSTSDLESFRSPDPTRNTSDSGKTDSGKTDSGKTDTESIHSRQSSYTAPSRQSSYTAPPDNFDDLNNEKTPLSPLVEGNEAGTPKAQGLEAQGLSASASATPDIDTDVCSLQIDQFGVETIPIFVKEMFRILKIQGSENIEINPSGAIKDTFIDQDKIDRLPKPIKEFAEVELLKFLIYNKYDFKIGGQKDYAPMSIYGDTITLKNIILTLIYNCLGDDVVDEMKEIDDSEWYECIGELGYEPEQGKGGKKGKKRKNTTRKRGGMPPKEETFGEKTKRRVFSALNFCGIVCNSLYDILIIVSILISLYYGVQSFIDSYEALTPIRTVMIEPLKEALTNSTNTIGELSLSESDRELIALDNMSLQYIGENPNEQRFRNRIVDVGTHVVLIAVGSLAQIFNSSPEYLHFTALAALGLNDGSQKMDQVIIDGMDSIFKECFYDLTTPQGITLARTTLRTLRIDQPSRELIRRIIDGKQAEQEHLKSSLPPSPDEIAAEAEISTTEESVGIWSMTVNSVSGFVGKTKKAAVAVAVEGKNKVDEIGVAIKVATTAFDRAECMKREFKEIYDKNRRKYEDFVAEIRGQSNRITTAISYSRTEAWTGWALIGFSLYMLSYLRKRGKDQIIEQRLAAVENGQAQAAQGLLAIGNGDEPAAQGLLAIENVGQANNAAAAQGLLAIENVGQANNAAAAQRQLRANPWGDPNLRVRIVGQSPGRPRPQQQAPQGQAQQGQAQQGQAQQGQAPGGGGRRKTKKRRRQTKKPRRITRKRRRM